MRLALSMRFVPALYLVLLSPTGGLSNAQTGSSPNKTIFEQQMEPVLRANCAGCHSAANASGGLTPAPPASKRALLRRVYFDLIGLPPTPQDLAAFEADSSADAYEKVLDKLLADSRYGERWARHWLDLARFAESDGFAIDGERPTAWRYRDYVIRPLNHDKPYDQFVREQLAGDEVPAADAGKGGGRERADRRVPLAF